MFWMLAAAHAESHVDASLTVQVDDRDTAIRAVIARAEAAGGWFSALSDDGVTVRVPTPTAAELVEGGRALGQMVERTWSAQDLDAQLVDLRARLASREGVLKRYLEILGGARSDSVVAVEREITRTVAEIEGLRGKIAFLEHQAAYAVARLCGLEGQHGRRSRRLHRLENALSREGHGSPQVDGD